MKIVIVGIGKLGSYLTKQLVDDSNEITIVDLDFSNKSVIINNLDINYVEGNGLDSDILIEAGVSSCDLLISVMARDEDNIMCSLIGRKLGAKHTIARIRSVEYSNSIALLKDELGLSMTINPELLTASHVARTLNIPSALDVTTFLKGKIEVVSLKIKKDSKLNNITINNLINKSNTNIIVCAIERAGKVFIPRGNTKILEDDKIHVTGTRSDINNLLKYMGLISNKTKSVLIAGGSSVCVYLTKILCDMGIKVKIIEIDKNRCIELSEKLPKAIIVNGDVSNQETLFEEEIEKYDAFIALTSIDEENIVYSMFARLLEVPKIITKVNHIKLDGVTKMANIDAIVAPHKIATNQIVQYVRAMEDSSSSSCEAIFKYDDIFEMLEFIVLDNFKGLNKNIKDLKIKDDILIGAIQRDKNVIFPTGNDEILLNDKVVIVSKSEKLKDLNDILG